MSKHWKPKPTQVEWQTCGRHSKAPCDICGETPRGIRCVITEQTSWMRGDDEVTFRCIPCAIVRGVVPSNAVCHLLFDAMTPEERVTIAGRLRPEAAKELEPSCGT
jgi:hypothetical protein